MKTTRLRRGMTMIESMMSVSIFSAVGLFVVYVTVAVAQQSGETIRLVPAEQQSYRAMDFVRRGLLPAEMGSVRIDQDGRGITFRNPSRTANSRIEFVEREKVLRFDPNVSVNGDEVIWGRNLEGSFERLDTPRRIRVTVTSTTRNSKLNSVRMKYIDDLTIRN